jgi:hypothetical protein
MKAHVKVTLEWDVKLNEDWYEIPTPEEIIRVEKESFHRDMYSFIDAMDREADDTYEFIEITEIKG